MLGKYNANFPEIATLTKDKQVNQTLLTYDEEQHNKTFTCEKLNTADLFGNAYNRKRMIQPNSSMTQEVSPNLKIISKSRFSSKNSPTNRNGDYKGGGFGDMPIVLNKCSF